MLKNWDWKHTLAGFAALGFLICTYLAEQAKDGQALPFHLTAAGLGLAAYVFAAFGKQLGADK